MHTNSGTAGLRVRPRVWLGLAAFIAYLAVFYAIWIVNGIDYARVGESEETLLRWYVAPLAGGLVVLLIVISFFGWWRPSLRETTRLPRSAAVVPAIMAAVAILNLVFGEFSRVTMTMWILVARGQLFIALRSRFGEVGVWFLSTSLFSLLHLPNFFFGIGSLAFLQVVIQFGLGSVYYLAFRSTGSLVPAMLLHGLWDFSTFSSSLPYAGLAAPFIGIAGVVVAVVLLAKERRRNLTGEPIR
jgi:membrane protease YdiL (CAAX protease family)